jgi:hypothetical protein
MAGDDTTEGVLKMSTDSAKKIETILAHLREASASGMLGVISARSAIPESVLRAFIDGTATIGEGGIIPLLKAFVLEHYVEAEMQLRLLPVDPPTDPYNLRAVRRG